MAKTKKEAEAPFFYLQIQLCIIYTTAMDGGSINNAGAVIYKNRTFLLKISL